jgi:phosphoglycolate phosphatase
MTLQPKRFPRAVLFDWDNTLVDTKHKTLSAINAVCHAFDQTPMTMEEFSEKPSVTIRDFIRTLLPEQHVMHAEKIFFNHVGESSDMAHLPHATTLIHWLHQFDVPTAIVSNKGGDRLRKEIQILELSHVFYCAIGSGDTHEDKPSSVPLLHALSHRNIEPSEDIWFVGDSVVDMLCAHNAGCTPVSVAPQADAFIHPKIKAGDCQGLLHILQTIFGR